MLDVQFLECITVSRKADHIEFVVVSHPLGYRDAIQGLLADTLYTTFLLSILHYVARYRRHEPSFLSLIRLPFRNRANGVCSNFWDRQNC